MENKMEYHGDEDELAQEAEELRQQKADEDTEYLQLMEWEEVNANE